MESGEESSRRSCLQLALWKEVRGLSIGVLWWGSGRRVDPHLPPLTGVPGVVFWSQLSRDVLVQGRDGHLGGVGSHSKASGMCDDSQTPTEMPCPHPNSSLPLPPEELSTAGRTPRHEGAMT